MRRHGGSEAASPSIIHTSSIALLRERFRNLQKVKEMRQGRELQRAHTADTDRTAGPSPPPSSLSSALSLGLQAANNSNEQPRWFLHPDLIRPSRPLRGPAYHHGLIGANGVQTTSPPPPPPPSSWGGAQSYSGYRSDVVVDVDTSLHL